MNYDPVSLLRVHHVESRERLSAQRRSRPVRPSLRSAATAVVHSVVRAAYVRTRAAHLASSRPA